MKQTYSFLFPFICLLLNACSDNNEPVKPDDGDEVERSEIQIWIEDTMRDEYLWNSKIPAAGKLDYSKTEEDFFTTLLYKDEDGKTRDNTHSYYSYIEKISETRGYVDEDYTYGMEFSLVRFVQEDKSLIYGALVLSVMDESPAKDAGLKRGDWILSIGDKAMTNNSDILKLYGGAKTTLKVGRWNEEQKAFIDTKTIEIEEAKAIDYNPIHYYRTYTIGAKKVGYLVYNSFKAGINDTGTAYDDKLRELSNNEFNGVDEFVLDLRYNGGGLLTSTELMCAILGPSRILSEKLGYLEYNDRRKSYFSAASNKGTAHNLNLSRLFVLVSASTASASEAVINLLNPYMDVVVIGRPTEGKNLASNPFTSSDEVWEMHPITSKIFNIKGESDYANGWIPNIDKGDVFNYTDDGYVVLQEDIYDFGHPQERLLKIALGIIAGTYTDDTTRATDTSETYELGPNSLDRRATPAVMVD